MAVMVLWRKDVAGRDANFAMATHAAVDASKRRYNARLMVRVESSIVRRLKILRLLVECHNESPDYLVIAL
jgi:hypothetical protein